MERHDKVFLVDRFVFGLTGESMKFYDSFYFINLKWLFMITSWSSYQASSYQWTYKIMSGDQVRSN